MGRRFDKKNATTFNVVHRAHDDAKFFDDEASEHVLVPQTKKQEPRKKVFTTSDLQAKLANEDIRDNEGLAAQYGITYDDSKYDYMQHLKPMGHSDAVFVGAKQQEPEKKQTIEDLIRDQLPSEQTRKVARDLNQSIPDELQGFNPNMDPRLREVLEALEDEAYIGEEDEQADEDVFNTLLKSGEVEDEDDFYYGSGAEEYDEWDLDNYEDEYNEKYELGEPTEAVEPGTVNQDWQRDFMKFKKETKNKANEWDSDDEFEDEEDDVPDLPSIAGKKMSKTKMRKKKGAMTDTSSFSMSSSALFRTEGLTLLDDRYEQLNKKFESDEQEETHKPFNMKEERHDLEGMLDEFLDNYELESGGRKLAKKDEEKKKLQKAASSVSKGKAARKLNLAFSDMTI
ncbi:Protein LTV1 [Candida viswanathii]|uniref:Protein LTV1 n=1 Tax=Candida viswanathii TaxID=5486 RepID=A0A367YM35_9ASCO|nr:Protein LTV1 [Candida viswanathii]